MSQEKRPSPAGAGNHAPILHRYDPRQTPTLPPVTTPPAAATDLVQSQPASGRTAPPDPGVLPDAGSSPDAGNSAENPATKPARPVEIGGPTGPEPTRYGDWERNGRVSDF